MIKTRANLIWGILPAIMIVFMSGTLIHEDNSFIDALRERLTRFNINYHIEKTFLLTDRFVYRPGEDLWFKGFVASSGAQQQQSYSQDFFIKLVTSKGDEVAFRRYPLVNRQSAGRLLIPRTSIPGKYWLIGYTGWMKNNCPQEAFRKEILISKYFEKRFKVDILFNKVVYYPQDTLIANIKILDPAGKPITGIDFDYSIGSFTRQDIKGTGKTDIRGFSRIVDIIPGTPEMLMLTIEIRNRKLSGDYTYIIPSTSIDPVIIFFPEGGNLVYGLKNNMAVKAVNNVGLPAIISGEIINHNGSVLQTICTDAAGKAKFEYLPTRDTCYLRITKPDNSLKHYPLPLPNKNGFVIRLLESGTDSVRISITAGDERSLTTSHWVAVMDRQIVWSDNVHFTKSINKAIPVKHLKSGILQVSVFDQNHVLVAERLININNNEGQILAKTDHLVYHNRQRVNLLVENPGNINKVNLALTVSLSELSQNTRTTDFRGVINSNACDTNSLHSWNHDQIRDLDLLTTNYRNVYWNDLLSDTGTNQPFTRHDGLLGRVFDKKENLSQHAKIRVTHIPNYRSYETQSDENGMFQVEFGSDIIDFNYLNVVAFDALGKVNLVPAIDQSFAEGLRTTLIAESQNNNQQKTVDILSYGEPDLVYVLRYGPGKFRKTATEAKKKYDPNQYADYTDVLDIIQEIKPYKLSNNSIVFLNNDEINPENPSLEGAIIVINGALKGNNSSVLNSLLPSDITNINISTSLLDVHKYTPLNFIGVIEITTIQGMYKYRQPTFQIGMDVLNSDREFYSPDYSLESTTSGDNRKTLYWNPKLELDSPKPLLITFYTSDIKGVFYGRLVGIDDTGNSVEGEFSFMVE